MYGLRSTVQFDRTTFTDSNLTRLNLSSSTTSYYGHGSLTGDSWLRNVTFTHTANRATETLVGARVELYGDQSWPHPDVRETLDLTSVKFDNVDVYLDNLTTPHFASTTFSHSPLWLGNTSLDSSFGSNNYTHTSDVTFINNGFGTYFGEGANTLTGPVTIYSAPTVYIGQKGLTTKGDIQIWNSKIMGPGSQAQSGWTNDGGHVLLFNVRIYETPLYAANDGTTEILSSILYKSPVFSYGTGTVKLKDSELHESPVSTPNGGKVDLEVSKLYHSPVDTSSNGSLQVSGSILDQSPITARDQSKVSLSSGTVIFVGPGQTGATLHDMSAITAQGTTENAVVFTGVCDRVTVPGRPLDSSCASAVDKRGGTAVAFSGKSDWGYVINSLDWIFEHGGPWTFAFTFDHTVFANVETGVDLGPLGLLYPLHPVLLGSVIPTRFKNVDFINTTDAVKNGSAYWLGSLPVLGCGYSRYESLIGTYYGPTGHGWTVNASGLLSGIISNYTLPGVSKALKIRPPAKSTATAFEIPVGLSADLLVSGLSLPPLPHAAGLNNLPYNIETCSIPVPNISAPVPVPTAIPGLTTPYVDMHANLGPNTAQGQNIAWMADASIDNYPRPDPTTFVPLFPSLWIPWDTVMEVLPKNDPLDPEDPTAPVLYKLPGAPNAPHVERQPDGTVAVSLDLDVLQNGKVYTVDVPLGSTEIPDQSVWQSHDLEPSQEKWIDTGPPAAPNMVRLYRYSVEWWFSPDNWSELSPVAVAPPSAPTNVRVSVTDEPNLSQTLTITWMQNAQDPVDRYTATIVGGNSLTGSTTYPVNVSPETTNSGDNIVHTGTINLPAGTNYRAPSGTLDLRAIVKTVFNNVPVDVTSEPGTNQ